MTYELAKQLKDAGFPQRPPNIEEKVEWEFVSTSISDEQCYVPTLSELIEACGDGLGELHNNGNGQFLAGGGAFDTYDWEWEFKTVGTPEEAVAKLWLALNSKIIAV